MNPGIDPDHSYLETTGDPWRTTLNNHIGLNTILFLHSVGVPNFLWVRVGVLQCHGNKDNQFFSFEHPLALDLRTCVATEPDILNFITVPGVVWYNISSTFAIYLGSK